MKKVLLIAYHFPPATGAGVHRSHKFASYLPKHGYKPYILTVDESELEKAGKKVDRGLMESIPVETEIIGTPLYDLTAFRNITYKLRVYRFFWYLLYPLLWEHSMIWSLKVFKIAKKIIEQNDIPLVYTSSGPFSTMLLAWRLKKHTNIKWVADLRDPFTDAYGWAFPSKLHWLFMRKFEKWLFQQPDHLIVNTPAVKELYDKRGIIINGENVSVLTNGY